VGALVSASRLPDIEKLLAVDQGRFVRRVEALTLITVEAAGA